MNRQQRKEKNLYWTRIKLGWAIGQINACAKALRRSKSWEAMCKLAVKARNQHAAEKSVLLSSKLLKRVPAESGGR